MDWKKEIAVMVYVKQALAEADKAKLWPHHLPAVAASEEKLARAEAQLGFRLDEQYRTFLSCADGWRGFYQTVDLFGTAELLGAGSMSYAREALGYLDPAMLAASGVKADELLPIAATTKDMDLFVLVKPQAKRAGTVIWYAGAEIERFNGFEEFFLAMVDYNRRQVSLSQSKS